jgi:hypothetical protein
MLRNDISIIWISATVIQNIQNVPGGKVNILGGNSIGNSKEKSLYKHVSYSERFPIIGKQYFKFGA